MQAVDKRILIKAANLYYTEGLKQSREKELPKSKQTHCTSSGNQNPLN